MNILINNQEVPVIIEHKNNKNLYIRVKEDLNIYVTCNKRVSLSEINSILEKNRKSLERMYNHQLEQNEKDSFYYYLGKKYTILYDESIKKYKLEDDLIIVKNEKMLEKFYHDECLRVYQERVEYWSQFFDYLPKFSIRIRKMTTRWGVCNRGNNIVTLNSELIKKDITLLDYVIVHELSHFKEANHSNRFWNEVAKRYPNYKEARRALRD